MKTKRTMKSIAAAALALSLVAAPAVQELSPLFSGTSLGINADAANTIKCTIAELPGKIASAGNYDTIEITDSGTLERNACLVIDKNLTINLGSAKIVGTQQITKSADITTTNENYEASLILVKSGKTVTINGGELNGGGTADAPLDHYVLANDGGTVTLKDTVVTNNSGSPAILKAQ